MRQSIFITLLTLSDSEPTSPLAPHGGNTETIPIRYEATGRDLGFQAEVEDVDSLGSDTVARSLLMNSKPCSIREAAAHWVERLRHKLDIMIEFGQFANPNFNVAVSFLLVACRGQSPLFETLQGGSAGMCQRGLVLSASEAVKVRSRWLPIGSCRYDPVQLLQHLGRSSRDGKF